MTITYFDQGRLPPRDADGMTVHPDLEDARWQHPESDEHLSNDSFKAAGLDITAVELEYDVSEDHPAWVSYYVDGSADISAWEPSVPDGEGWRLIAIYDCEGSPIALYVRERQEPAT